MTLPEPRPGDRIEAKGIYGNVEGEVVRVQDAPLGGREVVLDVTVPADAGMHWAIPVADVTVLKPNLP